MRRPADQRTFFEKHRLELMTVSLARSNESATFLRFWLMTMATGLAGYVFATYREPGFGHHWLSLVLLTVAVFFGFWSWGLQKTKAIERYEAAFAGDFEAYKKQAERRNHLIDGSAGMLLLLGVTTELVLAIDDQGWFLATVFALCGT